MLNEGTPIAEKKSFLIKYEFNLLEEGHVNTAYNVERFLHIHRCTFFVSVF